MAIILKTAPNANRYVVWDAEQGGPLLVANRATMLGLTGGDEARRDASRYLIDEARMARADATGTSSHNDIGSFTDPHLRVPLVSRPGQTGLLPRALLAEFVDSVLDDERYEAEQRYVHDTADTPAA